MVFYALLSPFLLFFLSFFGLCATHPYEELKQIAYMHGYGYKTGHLMQLKKTLSPFHKQLHQTSIAIPEFMGIPSPSIKELLAQNGFNLTKAWQTIARKHFSHTARKQILQTNRLPESVIKELKSSATLIKKSCQRITEKTHDQSLATFHDFIKKAQRNNWNLMVRSTGAEDSQELSNAGGNLTVCNVKPTIPEIMSAIGNVLASYISQKSLQQRLNAGDNSIFDEPLMPVLIQRMIGETFHKNNNTATIPVGCVVYSQELEGDADNVVVVQASYGHNAGVVDNLVATDTYYIHPKQTFSVIKHKAQRLVPKETKNKSGLTFQRNTKELASASCLSETVLRSLYELAKSLEETYKKPMDLEVIYMPETDTLYLVQARPIIMPQRTHQPTYLDLSTLKNLQSIACTTISSQNYTIQQIHHAQQLIMSSTLEEALNRYLCAPTKKQIKAVIVEQIPHVTSHATATFRGEGITILHCTDLNKLTEWLKQSDQIVVLDPQQNLIILSSSKQHQSFTPIAGWRNYPLPLNLTIPQHVLPQEKKYQDYYPRMNSAQLLNTLNDADQCRSEKALESLLARLGAVGRRHTSPLNPQSSFLSATQQRLRNLYAYAQSLAKNLGPLLTRPAHDKTRLLFTRFFECIMIQKPSEHTSTSYSYEALMNNLNNETLFYTRFIAPLIANKRINPKILQSNTIIFMITLAQNSALTNHVITNWITFIHDFFTSARPSQCKQFQAMINDLHELGGFSAWLNTAFNDAYIQAKESFQHCFEQLYHEYRDTKNILSTFKKKKELLAALAQEKWNEPQTAQQALSSFKKNILNYCASHHIKNHLKHKNVSGNILLRLSIISFLHEVISTFDTIIKTIKSTAHEDLSYKIQLLKDALRLYAQLLKPFKIPSRVIHHLMVVIKQQKNNAKALFPSSDFDVKNLINGLVTDDNEDENLEIELENMTSLEDVFTSIHQLLLYQLGHCIVKWRLLSFIAMPKLVKTFEASLGLVQDLTNISFKNDGITLGYHHKLRAHSLEIIVHYSQTDKSCTVTGRFYGYNEYCRWQIIADYLKAANALTVPRLETCNYSSSGLTWTWHITNNNDCNSVKKMLYNAIQTSYKLAIEYDDTIYYQAKTVLNKLYQHLVQSGTSPDALTRDMTTMLSNKTFSMLLLPHFSTLQPQSIDQNRAASILAKQMKKWLVRNDDNSLVYAFYAFDLLKQYAPHLIGQKKSRSNQNVYDAHIQGNKEPKRGLKKMINSLFIK